MICAPTTALQTKISHLGCVMRVRKLLGVVTVASVAVILVFRSGLVEAFSSKEMPKYFAFGTLVRKVPSCKCACEHSFIVMVRHFPE